MKLVCTIFLFLGFFVGFVKAQETSIGEKRIIVVFGEVARPLGIKFQEGITITKAIIRAGGLKNTAGKIIKIYRRTPETTVPTVVKVDLIKIIKKKSEDLLLQPFDIIEILPRKKNKKSRRGVFPNPSPFPIESYSFKAQETSVAEKRVIYVVGEVITPSEIKLEEGTTILKAIAMAGGLKKNAGKTVGIYRRMPGTTQPIVIKVNLKDIKKEKAEDLLLQPFDIIEIPLRKPRKGGDIDYVPNKTDLPVRSFD